jgi:hypothetical protein
MSRKSQPGSNGLRFTPQMESLDERITPSVAHLQPVGTIGTGSDTATHFLVLTPETAYAGESTTVTVIALDASNHIDRDYTGTVALTSSDSNATSPADYTFTDADRGVHVFSETFATLGTDSVTATDTSNGAITGTASVTVDAAPVATHFEILVQPEVYAGEQTQVLVLALDASNHVVKNYTGTFSLTSSDTAATLPDSYTFSASDHGAHVFDFTMGTTGTETLTATDTSNSSLSGTVSITVNPTQVATHFQVLARHSAIAGVPTQIMVVALDASNHIVQDYTGTVVLTSSDSDATLPASYTFTTADRGVHVFSVTLQTTGSETVTATDSNESTLTGSVSINVITHSSIHGFPDLWRGAWF